MRVAFTNLFIQRINHLNWVELPEPVFDWYVDKVGKNRFRLKAAKGEMIATSEGYASKQSCLEGIESVKKNAPMARIVGAKEKAE